MKTNKIDINNINYDFLRTNKVKMCVWYAVNIHKIKAFGNKSDEDT